MGDADEHGTLRAELSEARLRLRDITRQLDESLGAEQHSERLNDELERIRHSIATIEGRIAVLAGRA